MLAAAEAEGVAPNVVRFHVPEGFRPKVGNTLTIRDIIRDQVDGLFSKVGILHLTGCRCTICMGLV